MTTRTVEQQKRDKVDVAWVVSLLATIQLRGIYGTLTIKFEEGRIKRVVREESLLPQTVEDEVPP